MTTFHLQRVFTISTFTRDFIDFGYIVYIIRHFVFHGVTYATSRNVLHLCHIRPNIHEVYMSHHEILL